MCTNSGGARRTTSTFQRRWGVLVGVLTVMGSDLKVVGREAALQMSSLCWKTRTPSFKHRWGKLVQVLTVIGHMAIGCFAEAVALLYDCRLPHDHPIIHV